jgi:serine/threonine protein kinase
MEEYIEELLDNYRLISLLGKGGFGKVYLAEHIYHKTRVAIKVLPPLDQDDLPNFLNEARTFRLNHRHIVRMLDFGVAHGVP